MSTADFTVKTTADTVRIHRATCKRQGATVPMADVALDRLATARPASCCKPNARAVEDALAELATAAYQHELAEPVEEQPANAEPVEEQPAVVAFADSGVAKHYYPIFCRHGATTLADALGIQVRTTAHAATLTGDGAEEAAETLRTMWADGAAAFTEWRTTDAEYLAVKAADKGIAWGKSKKRIAELAWLQDYVERTVQEVGEAR